MIEENYCGEVSCKKVAIEHLCPMRMLGTRELTREHDRWCCAIVIGWVPQDSLKRKNVWDLTIPLEWPTRPSNLVFVPD